jgi:phosphomannomutase
MQTNPIAFYELVMKARDPNHRFFGDTKEVLQRLEFVQPNGNLYDSIRNVVVSAVEGEGLGMGLASPIKPGAEPTTGARLASNYQDLVKILPGVQAYAFDIGGTLAEEEEVLDDMVAKMAALLNAGRNVAIISAREIERIGAYIEKKGGLIDQLHHGTGKNFRVYGDRVTKIYNIGNDGKLHQISVIPFPASADRDAILRTAQDVAEQSNKMLTEHPGLSQAVRTLLKENPLRGEIGPECVQITSKASIDIKGDKTAGEARAILKSTLEKALKEKGLLTDELMIILDGKKGVYVKNKNADKPGAVRHFQNDLNLPSNQVIYIADQFAGKSTADLPVVETGVLILNVGPDKQTGDYPNLYNSDHVGPPATAEFLDAAIQASPGARLAEVREMPAADLAVKIEFGTSGWRSSTEKGYTIDNVGRIAQAAVNYFQEETSRGGKNSQDLKIAVGFDARPGARRYAQRMVEVLAANGLHADLIDQINPTPLVAESTRNSVPAGERYDLAFQITASHNPVVDAVGSSSIQLGIKVLKEGIPAPDTLTGRIAALANDGSRNKTYTRLSYDEIPAELTAKGVDLLTKSNERLKKVFDFEKLRKAFFRVVIDCMHGATVNAAAVFDELGIVEARLRTVPLEKALADGLIPASVTDPASGQEIPWRPEPADFLLKDHLSEKLKPGMLGLAFDGDGDRAVFVDISGKIITPNEIGLIFAHYLYSKGERGAVVRTLPTTHTLDRFAKAKGLQLVETPVGSKWFKPYATGEKEDLLVGIEESGHVFFKYKGEIFADSAIAEAFLAIEIIAETGKSLHDYLQDVYKEIGQLHYVRTAVDPLIVNDAFTGKLKSLRKTGDFPEKFSRDIAQRTGKTLNVEKPFDLTDSSGVKVLFGDGTWTMYRVSGTDGSIRIYAEDATPEALSDLTKSVSDSLVQFVSGARLSQERISRRDFLRQAAGFVVSLAAGELVWTRYADAQDKTSGEGLALPFPKILKAVELKDLPEPAQKKIREIDAAVRDFQVKRLKMEEGGNLRIVARSREEFEEAKGELHGGVAEKAVEMIDEMVKEGWMKPRERDDIRKMFEDPKRGQENLVFALRVLIPQYFARYGVHFTVNELDVPGGLKIPQYEIRPVTSIKSEPVQVKALKDKPVRATFVTLGPDWVRTLHGFDARFPSIPPFHTRRMTDQIFMREDIVKLMAKDLVKKYRAIHARNPRAPEGTLLAAADEKDLVQRTVSNLILRSLFDSGVRAKEPDEKNEAIVRDLFLTENLQHEFLHVDDRLSSAVPADHPNINVFIEVRGVLAGILGASDPRFTLADVLAQSRRDTRTVGTHGVNLVYLANRFAFFHWKDKLAKAGDAAKEFKDLSLTARQTAWDSLGRLSKTDALSLAQKVWDEIQPKDNPFTRKQDVEIVPLSGARLSQGVLKKKEYVGLLYEATHPPVVTIGQERFLIRKDEESFYVLSAGDLLFEDSPGTLPVKGRERLQRFQSHNHPYPSTVELVPGKVVVTKLKGERFQVINLSKQEVHYLGVVPGETIHEPVSEEVVAENLRVLKDFAAKRRSVSPSVPAEESDSAIIDHVYLAVNEEGRMRSLGDLPRHVGPEEARIAVYLYVSGRVDYSAHIFYAQSKYVPASFAETIKRFNKETKADAGARLAEKGNAASRIPDQRVAREAIDFAAQLLSDGREEPFVREILAASDQFGKLTAAQTDYAVAIAGAKIEAQSWVENIRSAKNEGTSIDRIRGFADRILRSVGRPGDEHWLLVSIGRRFLEQIFRGTYPNATQKIRDAAETSLGSINEKLATLKTRFPDAASGTLERDHPSGARLAVYGTYVVGPDDRGSKPSAFLQKRGLSEGDFEADVEFQVKLVDEKFFWIRAEAEDFALRVLDDDLAAQGITDTAQIDFIRIEPPAKHYVSEGGRLAAAAKPQEEAGFRGFFVGVAHAFPSHRLNGARLAVDETIFDLVHKKGRFIARSREGIVVDLDRAALKEAGATQSERGEAVVVNTLQMTAAVTRSVAADLAPVAVSHRVPVIVEFNIDLLPEEDRQEYLDHLIAAMKAAKNKPYGKEGVHLRLKGQDRTQIERTRLENPSLFIDNDDDTLPADLKDARKVNITPASLGLRNDRVNIPVGTLRSGDVPAFEAILMLAIYSGRIDPGSVPDGFANAYRTLSGQNVPTDVLLAILKGAADIGTAARYAIVPVTRIDVNRIVQVFNNMVKAIGMAA